MRTAITGPPKSGKTTLGRQLNPGFLETDTLTALGWSEASGVASTWFDIDDPDLVVEGVAVPRALRKWLARNEHGKPVDRLIVISTPRVALTPGQHAMAQGLFTVIGGIVDELRTRGVAIVDIDANDDLLRTTEPTR